MLPDFRDDTLDKLCSESRQSMQFRFWDMDHTICDNDCDVSWKEFLIDTGRAPEADRRLVEKFYADYADNILEPDVFMAFQLKEIAGQTRDEAAAVSQAHFETVVRPRIYPQAETMIRRQLADGDRVILMTATNEVIGAPLAAHLGIELVATRLELEDGRYTGRVAGIYNCGDGKAENFEIFCAQNEIPVAATWYYGDSTSDQHILRAAGHPVAVNPMPALRTIAEAEGWEILEFRG